ncbi:MAG: hypothetical protein DRO36_02410 [Candidatus Hecatellales archaeon]|nr:MAG: hypothetical protein DRO36_02410 [Candidatus Hecatellales archaeon]
MLKLVKFPIPQNERKEFALKYSETLIALLKKYLRHRLPQEWSYEIAYKPSQNQNSGEEKLTIKIATTTSEGEYSNVLELPFMVYIPNKVYVNIPSFSELEDILLKFIQTSVLESVRPIKPKEVLSKP